MIGRFVVDQLIESGACVRVASLDDESRVPPDVEFMQVDLTQMHNCLDACDGMDVVLHLAGIKGSPKSTSQQPASFFYSTITFNTHMMEAARLQGVEKYLFTSSVGVYSPAPVLYEDDVWETFPSENDRFAGWAKRMGELQAQAYKIQYGWDKIAIVRPANVYGPFDNFDLTNAMVIPSIIYRILSGENPLVIWGDGSAVRDFIYAKDVAEGCIMAINNMPGLPINIGSGIGVSIKDLVTTIVEQCGVDVDVKWDTSKPVGDKIRLMDMARAKELLDFESQTSLEEGIKQTVEWYRSSKHVPHTHSVFR